MRVLIPTEILTFAEQFGLSDDGRQILAATIYRFVKNRGRYVQIHTGILEAMYSSHRRREFKAFLKKCPYFQPALNGWYRARISSKSYEIVGVPIQVRDAKTGENAWDEERQHIVIAPSVCSVFSGPVSSLTLDLPDYSRRFDDAAEKLGWFQWMDDAEFGLCMLSLPEMLDDDFLDLILEMRDCDMSRSKLGDRYTQIWQQLVFSPLDQLKRRDGRVYSVALQLA